MDKNTELTSINMPNEKHSKESSADDLHEARYAAFVENAVEGIWRIDFDPPIRLDGTMSEQVSQIFDRGVYTEANDAAAHCYGFNKGKEVVGRRLSDFMSKSAATNLETMTTFVQNRFYMRNLVTHEQCIGGKTLIGVNNITPHIQDGKVFYIWGASLDITDVYSLEEELDKTQRELVLQKQALEEKNVALKELVTFIELDKKDFKERIIANVDQVIMPLLEKITLSHTEESQIEQLRQALQDLTSSFGHKLTNRGANLTPRELEVCSLVKNGFNSKEIARRLKIALHTVEKHRRTARKKMGLTRKGVNLQTYLRSL